MQPSAIIRNLEIYDLFHIGNDDTIELYNWINDLFADLTIYTNNIGHPIYKKNDDQFIFLELDTKIAWVDYANFWDLIEVKYNMYYDQTQLVINYIIEKKLKVIGYTSKFW